MQNAALSPRVRKWLFLAAGAVFILAMALLLLSGLKDRPLHNDEGVNAWFLERLIKNNVYRYDPANYHGPSLYYIQLVTTWIYSFLTSPLHFSWSDTSAITATSIRLGVVGGGLMVLCGIFASHRRLGRLGTMTALVLMGTSSCFIFYSRYFIHEIFFVLFTLTMYLGLVYFRDTRRPVYFYLACASAALLYATKETSVIVFTVMALAFISAEVGAFMLRGFRRPTPYQTIRKQAYVFYRSIGTRYWIGLGIAFLIWGLLYSSFFTNPKGLIDSVRTYFTWTKTGIESGHEKRFGYFFEDLLLLYESPILFLAVVGAIMAVASRRRTGLFLFFWALGIFLAHSIIPYKTPWLVLSILLPMTLLAGYGVQTLAGYLYRKEHLALVMPALPLLLLVTAGLMVRQFPKTVWMTFVDNDNEIYPHIYVHTSRDIYRLVQDIDVIAERSGLGNEMEINVVSEVEWPMPFYLRHYPNAYFWRRYERVKNLKTPVIIAQESQHKGLEALLKDENYITRPYTLRKGAPLELWLRDDLRFE